MASNDNSSSRFSKFDRNRFRKIYPINRFPSSESFRSSQSINIESLKIKFKGGFSATGTLNNVYQSIPVIMVAPRVPDIQDPTMGGLEFDAAAHNFVKDQANINLFISSLTRDGSGKVSFTIESSAPFAGEAVVTVVSLA